MFDLLRIGYLDHDQVIAKLNEHNQGGSTCRCYICGECRVIIAERKLTDDVEPTNPSPPVNPSDLP